MKYLMLLVIVFVGIWWIRQQRHSHHTSKKNTSPQVMVPCSHCGTHVPENETLRGERGLYCSAEHRKAHES